MLQNSPTLGKIFEALAIAQGEMKDAVLDCENPHFKSKYASLKSVKAACKEALAKAKLSVNFQIFSIKETYYCRTVLGHGESGEWMSTTFKLLIDKGNMQGLGSAISYAKRYSLAAMVGVVDSEDDDGNAAVGKHSNAPAANSKAAPASSSKAPPAKPPPPQNAPATQADMDRLLDLMIDRNVHENSVQNLIQKGYGFTGKFPPKWVADEIGKLLDNEDTNDDTIAKKFAEVKKRREAAAAKGK
jgi:hypothetical protein